MLRREVFWLVGVLAVAATVFSGVARNDHDLGDLKSCKQNLRNISTALDLYSADYEGHYPWTWPPRRGSLRLLVPHYLNTMPTCPAAQQDTYSGGFEVAQCHDEYTLKCAGTWHARSGLAPDHPRCASDGPVASRWPSKVSMMGGKLPPGVTLCGLVPGMTLDEVTARLGPILLDARDRCRIPEDPYLVFLKGKRLCGIRTCIKGTLSCPSGSLRPGDSTSLARALLGPPAATDGRGPLEDTLIYENDNGTTRLEIEVEYSPEKGCDTIGTIELRTKWTHADP